MERKDNYTKSNRILSALKAMEENFSKEDIAKIREIAKKANGLIGTGTELKKAGFSAELITSPLPVMIIKKGNKKFALVNKKYVDKPDFVEGDIAGGLMESIEATINEMTHTHFANKINSVWDNGGETADRYTVVMKDGAGLGLSDNPDHPQGFSQWDDGVKPGSHLGKKITFQKLPPKVQKHVLSRLSDAYESVGLEDQEGKNSELVEVKIDDPDLVRQIDEWSKIKLRIKELEEEAKKLAKLIPFEKELVQTLESIIKPLNESMAQTDKYMVSFKSWSQEQPKPRYSEAFKLALTKVNKQTQKVLLDALAEVTNVAKVSASVDVTKLETLELEEGIKDKIVQAVKRLKDKFKSLLGEVRKLTMLTKELGKIASQK